MVGGGGRKKRSYRSGVKQLILGLSAEQRAKEWEQTTGEEKGKDDSASAQKLKTWDQRLGTKSPFRRH